MDKIKKTRIKIQHPFFPEKYLAFWYQISSIPQSFSKDCIRASASYSLIDDLTLGIQNICYDKNWNIIRSINGKGQILYPMYPAAINVNFNKFSLLEENRKSSDFSKEEKKPNYIIHKTDYENYSIVGTIDKSGLYILSRKKTMSYELYKKILEYCKKIGYDITLLIPDIGSIL